MYRSILVPLDGSPFAEQAVAVALTIAETSQAKVTLVRAWDPANYRYTSELTPPFLDPAAHDKLLAIEYLDDLVSQLRPTTTVTIDVTVAAGPAVDAIKECVTRIGADLVVMTTHGLTGLSRAWIGSVADALVRAVPVPVLLCRPLDRPSATPPGRFPCVLIPLDGSPEAEQILEHAAGIVGDSQVRFILLRVARPLSAPLHPQTVVPPDWEVDQAATEEIVTHARNYLQAKAEWLATRCPRATVDVDVRLAARAGAAIVDAATDYQANLVALTTHARRGIRLVLGSVADKVLRGTHGSVLVLRPTAVETREPQSEELLAGRMSGIVF